MYPLIRPNGDLIVIKKKNGPCKKYDIPLYVNKNGDHALHRVISVNSDGTYDILGDFLLNVEKNVSDDAVIGVLDSVIRKGREYKKDGLLLRTYGILWTKFLILRKILMKTVKMNKEA